MQLPDMHENSCDVCSYNVIRIFGVEMANIKIQTSLEACS